MESRRGKESLMNLWLLGIGIFLLGLAITIKLTYPSQKEKEWTLTLYQPAEEEELKVTKVDIETFWKMGFEKAMIRRFDLQKGQIVYLGTKDKKTYFQAERWFQHPLAYKLGEVETKGDRFTVKFVRDYVGFALVMIYGVFFSLVAAVIISFFSYMVLSLLTNLSL
jgi:hypothetical protein